MHRLGTRRRLERMIAEKDKLLAESPSLRLRHKNEGKMLDMTPQNAESNRNLHFPMRTWLEPLSQLATSPVREVMQGADGTKSRARGSSSVTRPD
jgi:hypothetical protein